MRMNYRDEIVESAELYFKAQIKKHKVNVDNLLENHIALAEHPDLMKTIEDEIRVIAEYEDKLNALMKHFSSSETKTKEILNG